MSTNYYIKNKERLLEESRLRYIKNKEKISNQKRLKLSNETQEEREKRLDFHKRYNVDYKQKNRELSQTNQYKYKQYKFAAKRRNFIFDLSEELFTELFHSSCNYCGTKDCRGIDRIDNLIGYTKENSTPCCDMCNKMKWKFSQNDFIKQIMAIYKNLQA